MRLRSLDLSCHATAEISLGDDSWQIFDVSPKRGSILIWWQHYHGPASVNWELAVIDPKTGTPIKRFPGLDEARFLDDGQIICGVLGAPWHRTVECLDVDTARRLGTTREWNAPKIQTAEKAKRAIITDYRRKFDWIDWVWETGSLKDRTVWDFSTGAAVVTWHPKTQPTVMGSMPLEVAISPGGEYLLEAGAGVLTLYKIEP
jgi:hypothetical protein